MEITIEVSDELAEQARARGLSIQGYVQQLLASQTNGGVKTRIPQTSTEIRVWLESLARLSEQIPPLPKVISREWIYQDRD